MYFPILSLLKAKLSKADNNTYAEISSRYIDPYLYFLIIPCSADRLLYKIQAFSKAANAEDQDHCMNGQKRKINVNK